MEEKKLKSCKANELFDGAVFYRKMPDGTFERAVVDLSEWETPEKLWYYRATIRDDSRKGLLYTRRDKPFKDFRDIEYSATINYSPGRQIILTRKT